MGVYEKTGLLLTWEKKREKKEGDDKERNMVEIQACIIPQSQRRHCTVAAAYLTQGSILEQLSF